jgi:hypothetical protein
MLPERLWIRTALGEELPVRLQGLTAGVANQYLITKEVSHWYELDKENEIKVPIFTLEPHPVATWAQMLSGKGSIWALGYVFDRDISRREKRLFQRSQGELTPQERVQRFLVMASPMARKLADLLSVSPVINLHVVRLIQETMLKDSLQVNVAEVFLGGEYAKFANSLKYIQKQLMTKSCEQTSNYQSKLPEILLSPEEQFLHHFKFDLIAGQTETQSLEIPLQLNIDAEPNVIPVTDNLNIQVVRCQNFLDCGLATWLLPDSVTQDKWTVQLDNQTLIPVKVTDATVVMQGEKTGNSVNNNEIYLTVTNQKLEAEIE